MGKKRRGEGGRDGIRILYLPLYYFQAIWEDPNRVADHYDHLTNRRVRIILSSTHGLKDDNTNNDEDSDHDDEFHHNVEVNP